MKKLVSIVLVLSFVFSLFTVSASAAVKTECGGECDNSPSIVIHGIGQSNVWALDENGDYLLDDNGKKISCFPAVFNVESIIKKVLVPALLTLITQNDIGLSDALCDVVLESFAVNMCDDTGKNTGNIELEKYPYSVAECSDYEKSQIYGNIPLQAYSEIAGEDHLYYFAYNSFGNHLDAVNELYDFIQMVKEETGHDKVNIVPISMGGSIANGLLEYYPEVVNDLNKVVYIVPALNGSTIVGDVLAKELTFLDPDFLYNGFLETLMDEDEARMIEVIARILPDDVLLGALDKVATCLIEDVMVNIPSIWALCPKEYYPELSQKYLASKPEIKKQTDMYYQAQLNSLKNIQNLVDNGVEVYNIVDYDAPLYQIGNSWNEDNADGVIHLSSTAMGVHSALVGETLPADYVQQNTYCSDPTHNHISPDRVVDASTGLLPDTTFYFDGQNHERTARNDVIIKLATKLLATDDIKDVYSDHGFPQFNVARDPRKLQSLVNQAKAVDASTLSSADAAELAAAIAEGEEIINKTAGFEGEIDASIERINACLVKAGVITVEEEEEPSTFFTDASLWLYNNFGTAGFSQIPFVAVKLLFENVFSFIGGILGGIF